MVKLHEGQGEGTKVRRIDELMENLKTGATLIVSEIILP